MAETAAWKAFHQPALSNGSAAEASSSGYAAPRSEGAHRHFPRGGAHLQGSVGGQPGGRRRRTRRLGDEISHTISRGFASGAESESGVGVAPLLPDMPLHRRRGMWGNSGATPAPASARICPDANPRIVCGVRGRIGAAPGIYLGYGTRTDPVNRGSPPGGKCRYALHFAARRSRELDASAARAG